ncbi:hypothetical protein [uncultured Pluralibacter sp.]|uniref:hypothetical protein n=1 Tax=uncultured Pluralibacter sp. TaxID=1490864 RepID=UPI00262BE075|nr:hypothetical protein [uncultured Pluralibacter sp.]
MPGVFFDKQAALGQDADEGYLLKNEIAVAFKKLRQPRGYICRKKNRRLLAAALPGNEQTGNQIGYFLFNTLGWAIKVIAAIIRLPVNVNPTRYG